LYINYTQTTVTMANKKSLQQGGAPEVRNNLEYLLSELQDKIQNQNIPVQQSVADLVSEGNNPQEIAQALLQIGYKEDDIKQIFNSLPTDEESSEVKQEVQQPQQQQAVERPQMQQEKIQQMQQEGVTAKKGKEMHSSIYDIPKAKQGMAFKDWMRQARRHGSINQNEMYQAPEARYLPMQKESYSPMDAMKNIGSNLMDFIDKTKTWNDNKEHLYNYKANVPEGVDIDDYAINAKELYRAATEKDSLGNNRFIRTKDNIGKIVKNKSRMYYDPKKNRYSFDIRNPYEEDNKKIDRMRKKEFGANYMKKSIPLSQFQGVDYDQSQAIGDYMYNKYMGNMPRGTVLGVDKYGMPIYQTGDTDYDLMLGQKKFNITQNNVDDAMNNLYNRKGATLDWVKKQIPNIEYGNSQRKPYWNGSYWEGAHPGSRNTPGYGWDNKKTWIWGSNKSKQLGGGTHNTYYAQIGGEPLSKRQWVAQNPAAQLKTASEIDLLYNNYTNNFQYDDYEIEYEPEEQTKTINFQEPTATITNKGWGDFRKGLDKFGDVAEATVNITGNVNKFLRGIDYDKQLGDATHQSADSIHGIDNPEKGNWAQGILQPDHQTEWMAQKGAELFPYSGLEEKAGYGNYWQTIYNNAQKLHKQKMLGDASYRLEQGDIDNKKYLVEPELYGDPRIGEFIAMSQDGKRVPREQLITDPDKLREFIGLRQEDKMPWLDKFYPDIKSKKAEYIKQPGGQINPFGKKKRQLRKRTGGQVANISTEVLRRLQATNGAKFDIL